MGGPPIPVGPVFWDQFRDHPSCCGPTAGPRRRVVGHGTSAGAVRIAAVRCGPGSGAVAPRSRRPSGLWCSSGCAAGSTRPHTGRGCGPSPTGNAPGQVATADSGSETPTWQGPHRPSDRSGRPSSSLGHGVIIELGADAGHGHPRRYPRLRRKRRPRQGRHCEGRWPHVGRRPRAPASSAGRPAARADRRRLGSGRLPSAEHPPVAAALHAPLLGETCLAALGAGATRNGRPSTPSAETDPAVTIVATRHPPFITRQSEAAKEAGLSLAAVLQFVGAVRNPGPTSWQIADTAAGRFDAFWQFGSDAANLLRGALVAREVGALVTDADGRPWTTRSNSFLTHRWDCTRRWWRLCAGTVHRSTALDKARRTSGRHCLRRRPDRGHGCRRADLAWFGGPVVARRRIEPRVGVKLPPQ